MNEQQQVTDYARTGGREFYYDGPRQRYLSRAMDVSDENPDNWKPTPEPQLWTDYLGDDPYADFAVTETWNEPLQRWEVAAPTETLGYLSGYGTHAQQDAQTGATRYLHADLIRSTMLTTDEGGTAVSAVSYTAFGEPIGDPEALGTRYRYAGGWGYEDDLLHLDGAPGTKPIVLLHVGWRWYDPSLGRFVQRDPLGLAGGLNPYDYVRNAPLTRIDPYGIFPPFDPWGPSYPPPWPFPPRPPRPPKPAPSRPPWRPAHAQSCAEAEAELAVGSALIGGLSWIGGPVTGVPTCVIVAGLNVYHHIQKYNEGYWD